MKHDKNLKNPGRICAGYLLHTFTASGAIFGLLALKAILDTNYILMFYYLLTCILIDTFDGWFARKIRVKEVIPRIDGALIDNMIDYFTYTLIPSFYLIQTDTLPKHFKLLIVAILVFSSTYQFARTDAKTEDCFFKGFPSYWSIVIFAMYAIQSGPLFNAFVILLFSMLSFIPIKYVYPTRLNYVSNNPLVRLLIYLIILVGIVGCIVWTLCTFPNTPSTPKILFFLIVAFYFGLSLYRTIKPLKLNS